MVLSLLRESPRMRASAETGDSRPRGEEESSWSIVAMDGGRLMLKGKSALIAAMFGSATLSLVRRGESEDSEDEVKDCPRWRCNNTDGTFRVFSREEPMSMSGDIGTP